jgi:hypothetical protein
MDYGTIQVMIFIKNRIYSVFFSDYINKNLAKTKNIEQDWILNTLPVSFYFNLK